MLEQVEKKIQELKITGAKEYYKKKDADLEEWGLSSKKDGKKKVPIIVTNEEYEELVKAANGVGGTGRNRIAKMLNVVALSVLVVGVIAGGAFITLAEELGFVYFSMSIIIAGISAAALKGIAEAVRLLQQIIDAKLIDAPEMSKEELEGKQVNQEEYEVPAQPYAQYPDVYVPGQPASPVVPHTAAQPPIYQAQYHQPPVVQSYQSQPVVYPSHAVNVDPVNDDEMKAAYGMFGERGTEPQYFD